MDTIKNIAAVIGCVSAALGLLGLLSQKFRTFVSSMVKRYSGSDDMHAELDEIKRMLEEHIAADEAFREQSAATDDITIRFCKEFCRNTIKDIFYRYEETKVIPLYEKKTLMSIEDLYIKRMNCNSYASLLLTEMQKWEVDYNRTHYEDDTPVGA